MNNSMNHKTLTLRNLKNIIFYLIEMNYKIKLCRLVEPIKSSLSP